MKAVLLRAYGGVDQLSYEDVPDPRPQPGEVIVKTTAISINPIDFKLRRGDMKQLMPLKLPAILGRDVSGEVVAVGDGVASLKIGQRVFGLVNCSYAELVACKATDLALLPDGLDAVDAAALPLVVLTGTQLIESGVVPKPGQTVLVTGALGSVGRIAVHIAKEHGATVIAGVRGSDVSKAAELEADSIVAVDDDAQIAALPSLDAIADTVGHEVIGKLLPKLNRNGVLATVVGKPASASGLDIRVSEVWAHPDPRRLVQVALAVQQGKFAVPISKRFKLSEIREAQQAAESGVGGKVVVIP